MDYATDITDSCPHSTSGPSAHIFLTLINALMLSKCQISNRDNYPPNKAGELQDQAEFDFIIVGSGSAGSIVANRLSENPQWKVLVLEAGHYPSPTTEVPRLAFNLQGGEDDWQFTAEPSEKACLGFKDGRNRWARGKCLGGSSSINIMLYLRGNRRDYDRWAQQGNIGWDYDSVLKYFKDLEGFANSSEYGQEGDLPLTRYRSEHPIREAIKESAKILGYPTLEAEEALGYFETPQSIKGGTRQNTGKVFLGGVKERPNLLVATQALVEKVIIDEDKRAKGVMVAVNGRTLTLKVRKEVILSAGAISTPQLLILSGVGPKEHLKNLKIPVVQDLKVGENLQDHIMFYGFYVSVAPTALKPVNHIDDIYRYFMYQEGAHSQVGIINFVGFINTRNDSEYPNLQFHHVIFEQNDVHLREIIRVTGMVDQIAEKMLELNRKSPLLVILPTLANPKSRGRILLRSKNPNDKPLIHPNYLDDPDDIQVLLEGVRFAEEQLKTEPFKQFNPQIVDLNVPGCESEEFRSDNYWKCAIRRLGTTVYHPVGTCKMGPESDRNAVVNSRLRVNGIKNLRVIDASIMPNLVTVNTNGPAMMIGNKGASLIKEDWGFIHDEL